MLRLVSWRLLTRLWLAASCLSLVCLLIVGRCGLHDTATGADLTGKGEPASGYVSLLEQREEENRDEVARLTAEIRALKLQLLQYQAQDNGPPSPLDSGNASAWCRRRRWGPEEEVAAGGGGEHEAIAFAHFTLTRVHPPAQGPGRRVVERPTGYHRKALFEAVNEALDQLNRNSTLHGRTKHVYTTDHFLEGIFRTVPTTGTEYEMHFRSPQGGQGGARVSVLRPFAPPLPLGSAPSAPKRLLHAILPLAGRLDTFRGFIDKFVKIALKNDRHVALTVVYFGEEGLSEARQVMTRVAAKGHSSALRLLALNETFDRVKGLRVGAQRPWHSHYTRAREDVLLFLADVDVVFSGRFLERCRWYARPAGAVYFPAVFSLYSPRLVYTLQGRPMPSETGQLVVSRDTGYWRDAGYGISCQYKSDFLRAIAGEGPGPGGSWGEEEVLLYRKFLKSPLRVVRATDPGIFHIWHPKVCSGPRQTEQYRACVRARAMTEGSHGQLGALAFRGREAEMAAPEAPKSGNKKNKKQPEMKAAKAKEET